MPGDVHANSAPVGQLGLECFATIWAICVVATVPINQGTATSEVQASVERLPF